MRETWVWSLGLEDPLEKEWQPTPVFLPGESHGRRSLVGYSPWGRKESVKTSLSLLNNLPVCLVKAMVFPEVKYGCESWTMKKNERWRIDAFELWCWRRLLRVPWTARRSNQSILKEINPGCSLDTETETPILWPHDVKSWLIGKDPDPGKDWRQEEKGMTGDEMVGWHHWLDGREFD